jgi:hypothetical protein
MAFGGFPARARILLKGTTSRNPSSSPHCGSVDIHFLVRLLSLFFGPFAVGRRTTRNSFRPQSRFNMPGKSHTDLTLGYVVSHEGAVSFLLCFKHVDYWERIASRGDWPSHSRHCPRHHVAATTNRHLTRSAGQPSGRRETRGVRECSTRKGPRAAGAR